MKVKVKGKELYLVAKKRKQAPVMTGNQEKAANFSNLAAAKNMRDDSLEFYPKNLEIVA